MQLKEAKMEIETLKKKKSQTPLDQSLDEIDTKLEDFHVQLQSLQTQAKHLEAHKQLGDSLLASAEQDLDAEEVGDLTNDATVKFCKRVKYLD